MLTSLLLWYLFYTETANDLVDLALRYREKGVVAMDIAGDELIPMDQRHMQAIKVLNYNCMT